MSSFLDPNDPRYSDTPNVDTHPLEGRGDPGRRREFRDESPFKDRISVVQDVPRDGYILVSEAELAEAMDMADPSIDDHEEEDHIIPADPPSPLTDRERLAEIVSDSLAATTEGTD